MREARRRLSQASLTLGMCVGIGLGMAGCTPSDAPGEPMGGPDRAHQEKMQEEMHQQPEG